MNFETTNTVITFSSEENLNIGDLVKISGNYTIKAASADETFDGVVISKQDNIFGVMLRGIVSVTYTGELNYGEAVVSCSSTTEIKTSTSGMSVKVLDIDTASKTAEILF